MYNPYSEGRWGRIFIESGDNGSIILVESDVEGVQTEGGILKIPSCYSLVDYIMDIHSVAGGEQSSFGGRTISEIGEQGITLPSGTCFDYCYIYVFIKRV